LKWCNAFVCVIDCPGKNAKSKRGKQQFNIRMIQITVFVTGIYTFSMTFEIFYDRTRKRWLLNTGACLIEATTWACLTVCWIDMHIKYSLPDCSRLEVSLNRKCISLKQHYCYSILAILLYKSHTKSIYSCEKYCNVALEHWRTFFVSLN
jgi:hypothetical protein